MRNIKSFTLIELLISISIFLLLSISLYSIFNTGMFSYKRMKGNLFVQQTARKIFNNISMDLSNSFAFSNEETRFLGDVNEIEFFALVEDSFSFVCYKLEGDSLFRLTKKDSESIKEDSSEQPKIIAKQIESLEFLYAFMAEDEGLYDWKYSWVGEDDEKNKFPVAVKVNLVLKDKYSSKEPKHVEFERIILLPLAGPQ